MFIFTADTRTCTASMCMYDLRHMRDLIALDVLIGARMSVIARSRRIDLC